MQGLPDPCVLPRHPGEKGNPSSAFGIHAQRLQRRALGTPPGARLRAATAHRARPPPARIHSLRSRCLRLPRTPPPATRCGTCVANVTAESADVIHRLRSTFGSLGMRKECGQKKDPEFSLCRRLWIPFQTPSRLLRTRLPRLLRRRRGSAVEHWLKTCSRLLQLPYLGACR